MAHITPLLPPHIQQVLLSIAIAMIKDFTYILFSLFHNTFAICIEMGLNDSIVKHFKPT